MSGRRARTRSRSHHGNGDWGRGGQGQSCNVSENRQNVVIFHKVHNSDMLMYVVCTNKIIEDVKLVYKILKKFLVQNY